MSTKIVSQSSPSLIIGIDEATKCPCIGSIFVSGVIADHEVIESWKAMGVKDSKLIAPKKREKLAEIIKETAHGFVLAQMTPAMIDDKSFNLNEWEMLTVLKIIQNLHKKGTPEKIYVDNWEHSAEHFHKRRDSLLAQTMKDKLREKKFVLNRKKLVSCEYVAEHQADEKYTVVGAASILAKTASDAQYRRYRKKFGDFGSGSPGDPKTRLFVWQHRHNPLPIIRTSWNTYKTLVNLESFEEDPLEIKRLMRKSNRSC
jgi:ribonuclease HII